MEKIGPRLHEQVVALLTGDMIPTAQLQVMELVRVSRSKRLR